MRILNTWTLEATAIHSLARPRTLALALIERVLPGKDPVESRSSLMRTQGVQKNKGRYVPSGRHPRIQAVAGGFMALTALLGMLRTVERNVSGGRDRDPSGASGALTPAFRSVNCPAFHRRVRTLAAEVLWDSMAICVGAGERRPYGTARSVGSGIFAFEEPISRPVRVAAGTDEAERARAQTTHPKKRRRR